MMPEGASEDRADQLATLGVIAHEMMVAPDMAELLSRAEEGERRARCLAGRQPARDAPRLGARERLAGRSRRGAHARLVGLRDGVARGQEERATSRRCCRPCSEVLTITRRVGEAKAAALGCRSTTRCSTSTSRAARRARIDALFAELERLPAGAAAAVHGAPAGAPARRCRSTGRSRSRRSARWARTDGGPSASTSAMAGSTSRRIRSPAARPTTCASPRATTRRISRAP